MQVDGYDIDVIVQGYPGKTVCHGGLGWSTIVLIRGHGRVALIDTGGMGVRGPLIERLKQRGLKPGDVTDLLLTHAHHDHMLNWTLVRHARIVDRRAGNGLGHQGAVGRNPGAGALRREIAGLADAARGGRRRGGDARHHRPRRPGPHSRPSDLPAQGQPSTT